jgi:ribosomal protein RSM22 (predicted rRNA methylase)
MQMRLPKLEQFDHLLILEPSTRECGRKLMEWRARFLAQGFQALAPCTHAEACPLLTHSNRDWCHQRTAFEAPDWWLALEERLPMKNRTLTYSYLLMSRTVSDQKWRGTTRVIGDTLEERGKTRQMICRGPQREFLSWLHKHGEPPRIPHGALLHGIETCQPKGGELRAGPESTLTWTE